MSNKFDLGSYEKSHILALHEQERKKLLNILDNPSTRSKIRTLAEQYTGKPGGGYDSVQTCKKQTPGNVAVKLGLNWASVKKSWGSTGTAADNLALRDALCDGWRPGDKKPDGQASNNQGQQSGDDGGTGQLEVSTQKQIDGGVTTTTTKGCVSAWTEGRFKDMDKKQGGFDKFQTKLNELLVQFPTLADAKKKGTLVLTSLNVTAGASNRYNGKVKADMTNDRRKEAVPCNNCTGDATANKNLATDRAANLAAYVKGVLKSQNIKIDPNVVGKEEGWNVDTGGHSDNSPNRDWKNYPNPGQFARVDFGFCGVDTTTEEQVITKEEFENCYQGIEIEVNFDGFVRNELKKKSGTWPDLKFHNCNAAVFEIFANGQQLVDSKGLTYADLNNFGSKNAEDPQSMNGVDKFAKFILNSETNKDKIQQMWQDAQAKKDYTGDINISLRCGPGDKIGKDRNSSTYGGGCHKGVGHVIVRNNGTEVANVIQGTPQGLGETVAMNPIQACKPTVKK